MAERIFILGAGPFAHEVQAYCRRLFPTSVTYLVSNTEEEGAISPVEYAEYVKDELADSLTYLGGGRMPVRERMAHEIEGRVGSPICISSAVWTDRIGDGTIIANCAVVAPDTDLAEHVLVNYGATIGHGSRVGRLSVVGPQVSLGGCCVVQDRVYIGAGALIRENLTVGEGSTIGMGAIVTRDVPPNSLVIGTNQVQPQPEQRRW